MINIITIIIVHAEQPFHSHVDNAQLPLIQQKVSWSTVFWVKQWDHVICSCEFSLFWRKYRVCFGQHPWYFKYLRRWNGISIPTRTDTSNLQGGQRAKASMRGFSVMLGEQHEKIPPSAAKWPSMPRMIDTGRCKKGDSSVRTMWSRASIFRSTTISRCFMGIHRPIQKIPGIHRHDSPCSLSIYIDLLKEDDMKTSKMGRIHRHVWLPGIYSAISTHVLRYLA